MIPRGLQTGKSVIEPPGMRIETALMPSNEATTETDGAFEIGIKGSRTRKARRNRGKKRDRWHNVKTRRRIKEAILKKQNGQCIYCCRTLLYPVPPRQLRDDVHPLAATFEHLTPVGKGGSERGRDNLALACYECNNRRQDRMTVEEFRAIRIQEMDLAMTFCQYMEGRQGT